MHQIQLNDKLYKEAERRAAEAGFPSVDEFIADVVSQELMESDGETPNLDHLFTPDRLAHIDKAEAEIKAGKFYTADQANAELAKRRAEWLRNNPR